MEDKFNYWIIGGGGGSLRGVEKAVMPVFIFILQISSRWLVAGNPTSDPSKLISQNAVTGSTARC